MTTINKANDRKCKRRWTRKDSRGILTERERRYIETGGYDRQIAHMIRLKMDKAIIEDLPLLLRNPLRLEISYDNVTTIPILEAYVKSLVWVLYRFHEYRLMSKRKRKGLKVTVAPREVWKVVNKTLKEAKREAPLRINEQKEEEHLWLKDRIRRP